MSMLINICQKKYDISICLYLHENRMRFDNKPNYKWKYNILDIKGKNRIKW